MSLKLTEAEWRSVNMASTPRHASHGQYDFSLNNVEADRNHGPVVESQQVRSAGFPPAPDCRRSAVVPDHSVIAALIPGGIDALISRRE